jgi:head-tail adaptor
MAQPFYTPTGEMDQQIDFYDRPTDPDPTTGQVKPDTLFASDVWAKIETLWSTSQPERLQNQILSEVSHRITIKYMPGLKEQMYIIYHHPDNGDMRMDIAQIGDPDFKRVELKILAIARGNAE